MNQRALAAEFVGTFMLMSSVLGAAFYSFGAPAGAAGILGVAFSIGLTVMALAFSIGHISGGHFNPAVTLGLVAGGRVNANTALGYIIAQCLGALAACALFYIIGRAPPTFAANGYDSLSMLRSGLLSVLRRHQTLEDRRGCHRDTGRRAAAIVRHRTCAGEVQLPVLREDRPAAGALPCDLQGFCRAEPAGDDPGRQIRQSSAAQPAERAI